MAHLANVKYNKLRKRTGVTIYSIKSRKEMTIHTYQGYQVNVSFKMNTHATKTVRTACAVDQSTFRIAIIGQT